MRWRDNAKDGQSEARVGPFVLFAQEDPQGSPYYGRWRLSCGSECVASGYVSVPDAIERGRHEAEKALLSALNQTMRELM